MENLRISKITPVRMAASEIGKQVHYTLGAGAFHEKHFCNQLLLGQFPMYGLVFGPKEVIIVMHILVHAVEIRVVLLNNE